MDEYRDSAPVITLPSKSEKPWPYDDRTGAFCLHMTYDRGPASQSVYLLMRKPNQRMAQIEAEVFATLLGLNGDAANDL